MSAGQETILAAVETWVRQKLDAGGPVAHDWPHTDTARRTARTRAAFMDAFVDQAQQELVTTDDGQKQNGG